MPDRGMTPHPSPVKALEPALFVGFLAFTSRGSLHTVRANSAQATVDPRGDIGHRAGDKKAAYERRPSPAIPRKAGRKTPRGRGQAAQDEDALRDTGAGIGLRLADQIGRAHV